MRSPFLAAAFVVLVGCGSSYNSNSSNNSVTSTDCTTANAQGTSTVVMQSMAYSPVCVKVSQGATVTFVNQDSVAHTVTTDSGQPESFDSGTISSGTSFQHTFNTIGTIAIHCNFHSNMHLTVIVDGTSY